MNRWSVKVQHRGTRRTFSLAAPSRPQAAREAQSLCQTIRTEGWDAATQARQRNASTSIRQASGASRAGPTKSDARYWKERLVRRKYMEARMTRGNEFSVRIEHGGIDHYFPLGTDDVERAAAQALAIYRSIVTQGWEAALEQFSREITVAVFWSTSPVACTYTTLFTFAGGTQSNPPGTNDPARQRKNILLIEPDPQVRRSLVAWLSRQPGFNCNAACQGAEEAQNLIRREQPELLLLNRASPDLSVVEFFEWLKSRLPDLPAFLYGIYQDSDHIFITLSGVTAGYIFRRRKPTELFEPIQGALRQRVLSAKEVLPRIRDYFQNLFASTQRGDESAGLASLTAREQEILSYVSKGFLDKQIAGALAISIWTVHNHLKHIYEKLNVHSRTEALIKYLQK